MKKIYLLSTLLLSGLAISQDALRAPNSYVFDVSKALNIKGLKIPVKKAYKVWESQNFYLNEALPASGVESTSVLWEDVAGLIRNVSLEGTGEQAKIKVEIDRSKGKGNAVVTYKIDGIVRWSWHIWVTDDPTTNTTYYAGIHQMKNVNNVLIGANTFMNRNLGATSGTFLGNEWNKSAGLMYMYGRKDPFPRLYNKDTSYYELSGEVGNVRHIYHSQFSGYSTAIYDSDVIQRDNNITVNIRNSVKNPFNPIIDKVGGGNPWYTPNPVIPASGTVAEKNHNLWSDDQKGSINANGAQYGISYTQQLKSPYDPCPNGWRVPSFHHATSNGNYFSPWGKNNNSTTTNEDIVSLNTSNAEVGAIKIYPNLGIDFTGSSNWNLGKYSLSGKYVLYKEPNQVMFYHQDIQSEAPLHSANMTFYTGTALGDTRNSSFVSDVARVDKDNGLGLNVFNAHTTNGTSAMAVRCVKDFNYQLTNIGGSTVSNYDFPTEFFTSTTPVDYRDGLELPNSYLFLSNSATALIKQIPVKKAFAMYNQYLTDHQEITGTLRSRILWTTNENLFQTVGLNYDNVDPKESKIDIKLNQNETGNAVITLESETGQIYWSWHIWVPADDPRTNAYTYTTENERVMVNTKGYTNSGAPPLITKFMDRNLGAIHAFPENIVTNETNTTLINKAANSGGLMYQWGRKDPIPSFNLVGNMGKYSIAIPNYDTSGVITSWTSMNDTYYNNPANNMIVLNKGSQTQALNIAKSEKVAQVLKFSAENPLKLLVQENGRDWLTNINGIYEERWGHASNKSPFDPCPQGWRVPDMSFLNSASTRNYVGKTGQTTATRGTSPWYFAKDQIFDFTESLVKADVLANIVEIRNSFRGIPQLIRYSIASDYGGTKIKRNSTDVFGWKFSNTTTGYNIGNYPATGALNLNTGNPLLNVKNSTGLWTAAMGTMNKGYAISMMMNENDLSTGTNDQASTNNVQNFHAFPQAALNVRCVQHEDIYRGGNGIAEDSNNGTMQVSDNNSRKLPEIYPVPTNEVLKISIMGRFDYEIYDYSGRLVQQGKFIDQEISVKELSAGDYILKVIDTEKDQYFTKKIIKK